MFWPLQSSFEFLGVPGDSKSPTLGVWVSSSHLAKVGLRQQDYVIQKALFNIQRLKVHVVDKNLAKANCTYTIKVCFINVNKTFSIKTFLHGKFTLGHNQRTNMWNQTISLVFSDKIFLMTNNMISLVPFYVLWSFRNGFEEEKNSWYGIHGYILPFSSWFSIMKSLGMNMYII